MQATALVRITPHPDGARRAPRAAIRALLQAARRVRRLPGFRRWQTFRSMDVSDALLVVTEWETADELRAAAADPELLALCSRAAAWPYSMSPVEPMQPAFDRRLTRRGSVAT